MSLASPILASWSYDFGEYTGTALGAQSAVSIDSIIASARATAVAMIATGAYGSTSATYRVIVRKDAAVPAGYSVEVRIVT